jgi:hypothetical protein
MITVLRNSQEPQDRRIFEKDLTRAQLAHRYWQLAESRQQVTRANSNKHNDRSNCADTLLPVKSDNQLELLTLSNTPRSLNLFVGIMPDPITATDIQVVLSSCNFFAAGKAIPQFDTWVPSSISISRRL